MSVNKPAANDPINELVAQLSTEARAIHDEMEEEVRASVRGDITKEEAHARVCAILVQLETLPKADRDALLRMIDTSARLYQARVQDGMEALAQAELAMKVIEFAQELEPSSGPNITAAEAIAILRRHGANHRTDRISGETHGDRTGNDIR